MAEVSTISVVSNDAHIVQVGSGNIVHNVPSDLTLNMKVNIDSSDPVSNCNVNPNINIYLGQETFPEKTSENVDREGVKVKVTDVSMTSEVKYDAKDKSAFCGCRWSEKAYKFFSGFFSKKYSHGCSHSDRKDCVKIMDRLNVELEPGDAILNGSSFVIYLGNGLIAQHDKASGKVVKLKLDTQSEFEKWELWNNGEFSDYFTQSDRVSRAEALIDTTFDGNDSDFIAWCFTGMRWTEASENGYKLYCH